MKQNLEKKIALLAVKTYNYGSLLQTFALQQYLKNEGYDNEIINYKKNNYLNQLLRLLYYPLFKQVFNKVLKNIFVFFIDKNIKSLLSNRNESYQKFLANLKFSKTYVGRKQLVLGAYSYSCFILGSDQVWNPMNYGADFFSMSFVPDDVIKITYAPSFGVTSIPKYQISKTKQFLKRIDFLSVREVSGQRLIKNLINRDSILVVDPTILVGRSFWDKVKGKRIISENYIMCYFLGPNPNHREYANKLSKKTGLKIVTLPHLDQLVKSDFNFGHIIPKNIGPFEFINLISNASFVCTDSFHGTVFSILYERQFVTFNRYNNSTGDSTNSRMNSLLTYVSLEDRLIDSKSDICGLINEENYNIAKNKICILRKASHEFLIKSLKTVHEK